LSLRASVGVAEQTHSQRRLGVHRNARLTPAGRLLLCERIEAGWPVAHAASSMGISRDRAYVWWRRYQAEGFAGLKDRSSRPRRSPTKTKAPIERRVVALRRRRGRHVTAGGLLRRDRSRSPRELTRGCRTNSIPDVPFGDTDRQRLSTDPRYHDLHRTPRQIDVVPLAVIAHRTAPLVLVPG
jgi:leucine-zipper of insertion element IS481